jgi:simple sugar transport system permease protein
MVGGRYYIGGTIIGAITIQTLTTTMYAVGVSSDRLPAVKAIVILLIIIFQSEKFKQMYSDYKFKRLKKAQTAGKGA